MEPASEAGQDDVPVFTAKPCNRAEWVRTRQPPLRGRGDARKGFLAL